MSGVFGDADSRDSNAEQAQTRQKRSDENAASKGEFTPVVRDLTEKLADDVDDVALRVQRASMLLEHHYYEAARKDCEEVLELLSRQARLAMAKLPALAHASSIRSRAIVRNALQKMTNSYVDDQFAQEMLEEAGAALSLAEHLCASCCDMEAAREEVADFRVVLENCEREPDESAPTHVASHVDTGRSQPTRSNGNAEEDAPVTSKAESHDRAHRNDANDVDFDVVIVGAGASGVGVGTALVTHFALSRDRVLIVERGQRVGDSFRRWPKEMRFISPSFNQAGWTSSYDLNSITHGTSPAVFLQDEHPSGEQYANYLESVANDIMLPIRFLTEVTKVCPFSQEGEPRFELHTQGARNTKDAVTSILKTKFVIWAAGEFQYPRASDSFPGAELCRHNSTVRSWAELPGKDFIVIGGYESGMDATAHLARSNKQVTVIASSPCWEENSRDPSSELAPYTRHRIREFCELPPGTRPRLLGGLRVTRVERNADEYVVHASHRRQTDAEQHLQAEEASRENEDVAASAASDQVFKTASPPILCTGFRGSVAAVVGSLFEWDSSSGPDQAGSPACASGSPRLTKQDESTLTEGLFLTGPMVSHEGLVFCFVYKFRQRFAVVAQAIASRLGRDTQMAVWTCRSADMYLDDFAGIHACCGD